MTQNPAACTGRDTSDMAITSNACGEGVASQTVEPGDNDAAPGRDTVVDGRGGEGPAWSWDSEAGKDLFKSRVMPYFATAPLSPHNTVSPAETPFSSLPGVVKKGVVAEAVAALEGVEGGGGGDVPIKSAGASGGESRAQKHWPAGGRWQPHDWSRIHAKHRVYFSLLVAYR